MLKRPWIASPLLIPLTTTTTIRLWHFFAEVVAPKTQICKWRGWCQIIKRARVNLSGSCLDVWCTQSNITCWRLLQELGKHLLRQGYLTAAGNAPPPRTLCLRTLKYTILSFTLLISCPVPGQSPGLVDIHYPLDVMISASRGQTHALSWGGGGERSRDQEIISSVSTELEGFLFGEVISTNLTFSGMFCRQQKETTVINKLPCINGEKYSPSLMGMCSETPSRVSWNSEPYTYSVCSVLARDQT